LNEGGRERVRMGERQWLAQGTLWACIVSSQGNSLALIRHDKSKMR
jgi:hypothetical protein